MVPSFLVLLVSMVACLFSFEHTPQSPQRNVLYYTDPFGLISFFSTHFVQDTTCHVVNHQCSHFRAAKFMLQTSYQPRIHSPKATKMSNFLKALLILHKKGRLYLY